MSELKPCPFCGCGEGNLYIVTIEQHGFDSVGIFCNGCKQTVILEENEWEGDNNQSRKKAIEAWNKRVGENPKGEWLRMSDLSEKDDNRYKCSRCGNVIHRKSRMDLYTFNSWCGRCGSDNSRHTNFIKQEGKA